MNKVKSFTFYQEYYELLDNLKLKDKEKITIAILDYVFKDEIPNLKGLNKAIFDNLKRPLDKSKTRSNVANAKWNANNMQNECKTNAKEDAHNMSLFNVNVNSNLESNKGVIGGKEKTFRKPTMEEIESYCKERGNNINANAFYDFYESKGWKVGNQSMKDWKACVRTWEQRTKKQQDKLPDWFDKKIKKEEISDERKREIEAIKNGTYKP